MDPEEELPGLLPAAQEAGVMAYLCVDAGRTEFHGVPDADLLCRRARLARPDRFDRWPSQAALIDEP